MATDRISLQAIFAECNSHLRDADKNRDQLISFYLLLVGAFIAYAASKKIDNEFITLGSLLLTVLGIIVSRTTNEFRLWHTRYSYTARLLTALARAKPRSSVRNIERKAREYTYRDLHNESMSKSMSVNWFRTKFMKGTEFYTYAASLIITFIPLYIFVSSFWSVSIVQLITLVISFALIFLVFSWISAQYYFDDVMKVPWAIWLLYQITPGVDLIYEYEKPKDSNKYVKKMAYKKTGD